MFLKQTSINLVENNITLKKYVESVRKKHEKDADYLKWDEKVS